jgi:hypothetical protein
MGEGTPFWCWVEGLDIATIMRALGGDPESGVSCRWDDLFFGPPLRDGDRLLWMGPLNEQWVQILEAGTTTITSREKGVLSVGRRLFAFGWGVNGPYDLRYWRDGRIVTSLGIWPFDYDPGVPEPHALDEYMEDLYFEERDGLEVQITSAMRLVGRITGRELDREWMEGAHMRYVIPHP